MYSHKDVLTERCTNILKIPCCQRVITGLVQRSNCNGWPQVKLFRSTLREEVILPLRMLGLEGAMPQHTPITCITMRSIRRQDATPFWKQDSSLRGSAGPPAQGRIAPFIVRNALHCFWRGFASIPNQSSQLLCAGPSILWNFEICWTIDICFSSNWGERGLGGWMGPYAAKTRTLDSGLGYYYYNPQNTNYTVKYGRLDSRLGDLPQETRTPNCLMPHSHS